ncbi:MULTISPECIES: hypothetical protein [Virgibacillus]|uniref:Sporulation lipoprotein YhcN/YlaJ (Spore_YhcN_YlaJ) n=2 Tax=Virgibacillus TaxID=84406 RepID=A0A024QDF8_9BACI|nr:MULTISPECIES: hypothetical protein [Virgibacillus]EQB36600.1 hypothetical protein M948_16335 [Virgibacillus sp. CM-4]MYL42432.1 hypothetical protein [Virgibacillus massiliensis]GGJ42535.1 hypothetical protein GCM10007111_00850 [Virgibacillus kapii]CDQ40297.1 hypothetical protein BN990_02617 [Virgibacillus massiliensis]
MQLGKWLLISAFLFTLIGCGTDSALDPPSKQRNEDIDLSEISTDQSISQEPSNRAKDILSHYDQITTIKAVNSDKEILIAIEIKHMERFKLAKIREQLTKEMKEEFDNLKVELSTDKKIVMELDKLEKNLKKQVYPKKDLQKKLNKLVEFSKEQT